MSAIFSCRYHTTVSELIKDDVLILQVSGDDDAKYTVKAVNSLGEATCTAELLVEVMAGEEEEEEEEE